MFEITVHVHLAPDPELLELHHRHHREVMQALDLIAGGLVDLVRDGQHPDAARLRFAIGPVTEQSPQQGRVSMLRMTDTQQSVLTIRVTDARGHTAPLDGVPLWETSDPAVVTVEPAEDGLSAVVKANGMGAALVSVTGDAKLGDEVKPIVGTLDLIVDGGDAVAVEITAGAPTEQL